MKQDILVSVVIPFYKNLVWLQEALTSVKTQTYKNVEVIVVIDGSPEECTNLFQEFPQYKFVRTENKGAGAARNHGIDISTGEFICFLDADDLWYPQKIERQLQFMLKNHCKWSHTNYELFFDGDLAQVKKINAKLSGNILPLMFITSPIATPCVMIQGNVLRDFADLRFSSIYRVGEDSYLWFKLAEKFELGLVVESLTKVRMRGSNAAQNYFLQLESKAQAYNLVKTSKPYFRNDIHFKAVCFGFYVSQVLYRHLSGGSQKNTLVNKNKEKIAVLFYSIPYLYLKSVSKIFKL